MAPIDFWCSTRREVRKIVGDSWALSDEMLKIATWGEGIDLNDEGQRRAFIKIMDDTRPDIVIIGPTYKMAEDLEKEGPSKKLTEFIDALRVSHDCAIIMESHQPHQVIASDGKKFRPERPYGSSLWMRWPEFGYCLEDEGRFRPWRGARDADREWPEKLIRGGEWPFTVAARECAVCGAHLAPRQHRYCSEKCGATWRKREERARDRA